MSEFIEKAQIVHGSKYGYDVAVYARATKKISITCFEHGIFKQTPNSHLNGNGCPNCGIVSGGQLRSMGTAGFIAKANALHGARYSYEAVFYTRRTKKVKISCPEHGIFEQAPCNHLKGSGCPSCGKSKAAQFQKSLAATLISFIDAAQTLHNFKYNYSLSSYSNNRTITTIICPIHDAFKQRAYAHLQGGGCPKCKQDKAALEWVEQGKGRAATLYLVRLFDETEQFFKVGITHRTVNKRYDGYKSRSGYQYEVLAMHESINAAAVYDWEQSILETFAHLRYRPKRQFDGATECFSSADEILEIFPL